MKTACGKFLICAWLAWAASAIANTIIYPVESIDDFWRLAAEEFRAKYGGINVTGLGVDDEGWYVRYRHENLTLFFGPLKERAEARRKMWDLETVRDAAIRERPSLASSKVDFVRFTYSGIFGARGDTPFRGKRAEPNDGKNGANGDLDGDGILNNQDDDRDGDGIPNGKDPDIDGDGIPNEQDGYGYGKMGGDPAQELAGGEGNGQGGAGQGGDKNGGAGDKDGGGSGQTGDKTGGDGDQPQRIAGLDGNSDGQVGSQGDDKNGGAGGDQKNQRGGGQQGGQAGQGGDSSDQQTGQGGQQGQRVASIPQSGNQRGQRGGQQGGGQGQQGGQPGQSGQSGQQGGQSGTSGQGGQAGQPGMPGGTPSQGGGGNPLDLVFILLRKILGLG